MRNLVLSVLLMASAAGCGKKDPAPAAPAKVESPAPAKPAEAKPAEAKPTEAKPAEGEAKPAEAKPAEGEAKPAEGEAKPAEGEAKPAEGDAAKPAEGEAKPAEGAAKGTPYTKEGLGMTVPEKWSVTQDEIDAEGGWARTIHVENEDSGLVILSCFKLLEASPEKFLAQVLEEMTKASDAIKVQMTGEAVPTKATIAGAEREGITRRFNVVVEGLSVPHTTSAYRVDVADLQCIAMAQASDDELEGCKAPFELIFTTLASAK